MVEELFEVFDVKSNQVYGTNMDKEVALVLMNALFNHYYRECNMQLGIRRTEATVKALTMED